MFRTGPAAPGNIAALHYGVFEAMPKEALKDQQIGVSRSLFYITSEMAANPSFTAFVCILSSLYLRLSDEWRINGFGEIKFVTSG